MYNRVKTEGRTKYLKCDVSGCDGLAKLVDGLLYVGVRRNRHISCHCLSCHPSPENKKESYACIKACINRYDSGACTPTQLLDAMSHSMDAHIAALNDYLRGDSDDDDDGADEDVLRQTIYNESFARLVILYTALVTSLHSCTVHPCHVVPHCPLPQIPSTRQCLPIAAGRSKIGLGSQ